MFKYKVQGDKEWAVKALERTEEKNKTIIDTEAAREAEKGINSKGKEDRREINGKTM